MAIKHLLAVGATLVLSVPALAQRGGHPGGGGGHPSAGHVGGASASGAYRGGYAGGSNVYRGGYYGGANAYRGGYYGGYPYRSGFGVGIGLGGIGLGYGSGYGYGLGGYGYGGYGYGLGRYGYGGYGGYYGSSYVLPRTYVVPTVVAASPGVVVGPTSVTAPQAAASETGLLISELKDAGPARAAGLRRGDVILAVDGQRTRSLDELRGVLTAAKKDVTVEFLDGSNGQVDRKTMPVADTKLGITVEEVPLTRQ